VQTVDVAVKMLKVKKENITPAFLDKFRREIGMLK
jgi:hypothetical protein